MTEPELFTWREVRRAATAHAFLTAEQLEAMRAEPGYQKYRALGDALLVVRCGGDNARCGKLLLVVSGPLFASEDFWRVSVFKRSCKHDYDLQQFDQEFLRATVDPDASDPDLVMLPGERASSTVLQYPAAQVVQFTDFIVPTHEPD